MASVEIAVIGAGSAQFSMGLVRDLVCLPSMAGSHVRLMDVDPKRLDTMHAVAERYAAETGAHLKFTKTLDRAEALRGADFVVNCALVGGWHGGDYLRPILEKHGLAGRGRGGGSRLLRSFRQYDLFASVARDIASLCPAAWYIQSSNPMTSGITLVARVAGIKAVGLCHGFNDVFRIAKRIGLDPAKVTAQAYGLNHFIWLTNFTCDGRDAYPVLDEWIEKSAPAFWKSPDCTPSCDLGPKAVEMYKLLGRYPIGDTCTPGGGNWPTWFRKTPELAAQWNEDSGAWIARHIDNMAARTGEFEQALADKATPLTAQHPATPTGETNVTIMDALANDHAGIFQVNVLNDGAIPGIGDDIAVEVPAYVSKAGIQKLKMDPLPERIMQFVRERELAIRQDVETYLSRSRTRLLLAVLGDGDMGIDQAQGLVADVLAHPGNEAMAAHFSER